MENVNAFHFDGNGIQTGIPLEGTSPPFFRVSGFRVEQDKFADRPPERDNGFLVGTSLYQAGVDGNKQMIFGPPTEDYLVVRINTRFPGEITGKIFPDFRDNELAARTYLYSRLVGNHDVAVAKMYPNQYVHVQIPIHGECALFYDKEEGLQAKDWKGFKQALERAAEEV